MDVNRKKYQFPVSIYLEDTDAGGVVYNANYLKFFERARTEWLKELGVSQQSLLQQQLGFVVCRVEMDNKKPARFEQSLTVISEIIELKKASLMFSQQLVDSDHLYCKAITKVACVDLQQMKPLAIPSDIFEVLKGAN